MKTEENYKKVALMFLIAIIVLGLGCMYQTFMVLKYHLLYDEAIKQGAEGIVLALELNVACQSLGNFTLEEVRDKWVEMFLFNEVEE